MPQKRSFTLLAISTYCIFITSIISGQHLITLFGLSVTSGMFIFPLTTVLIAVMTELEGARTSRRLIVYCAWANVMMLCVIFAVQQFPSTHSSIGDAAVYDLFLKRFSFILGVSTLAFIVSEYVNVFLLSSLNLLTQGKYFLQRVLCSTVCAVTVDTIIVFPFYLSRQSSFADAAFEAGKVLVLKIWVDIVILPLCVLLMSLLRQPRETALPPSALPFTSIYYLKQYE